MNNNINDYKETFDIFRKQYPGAKRGLETEFAAFCKKHKDWKEYIPNLLKGLQGEQRYKASCKSNGEFVPSWKNLPTWLNNSCWEYEYPEIVEVADKPKSQWDLLDWEKAIRESPDNKRFLILSGMQQGFNLKKYL